MISTPARYRVALVGVVTLGMLVAWQLGVFHTLSNPSELKATLIELGAWGYLAFVLTYMLFQPFGVPGTAFIVVAPLVWPWQIAFALSMTGTMAASIVGFSFARFVARDFVSSRIPQRFRKYERALEQRGFVTVFVLRAIFWMPPMLHAFFGVSKVRFWTHFWGSLAGYVAPLFVMSYFGERVFDEMTKVPRSTWIGLAFMLCLGGLGWWLVRRRRAATGTPRPSSSSD